MRLLQALHSQLSSAMKLVDSASTALNATSCVHTIKSRVARCRTLLSTGDELGLLVRAVTPPQGKISMRCRLISDTSTAW